MSLDREEILRRFEAWLDGVLASEELPQGIAAEFLSSLAAETELSTNGRCDLYAMWAALTALTQEVRLQGRSFKQLSETLAPVADLAPELPGMQHEARERARREMLDALLDLRDHLGRGLDAARATQARMGQTARSGWVAQLLARHRVLRQASESVAALEEGYQISVDHLDDVLAQVGVREIACQGQPFDPRSMQAVEVEESDEVAEGTVVEVYRAGYEWKGEIYRPAQVKVVRRPATDFQGDDYDG